MIAKVIDVDMGARKAIVVIPEAGGTRRLPDVKLTHRCSPGIGDCILVIPDDGEYYGIDRVDMETPEAIEAASKSQLTPGDEIMGDPENGTGIAVRKGGLISILANKVTGIVLSKINGFLQLFGKSINVDTTFFHGRIRTNADDRNTFLELSLFGSPFSNPLSTEIIKASLDTMMAKGTLEVGGMKDINIDVNIAPQTGIVTGPNFNFNLATPQGIAKLKINGATGVVEVSSPTVLKLGAPFVFINSDGNPLDRVLTAKTISPATGNIIGQGSRKVFIGK